MRDSQIAYALPEEIQTGDNGARFDLNDARVDQLADSILSEGQVLQPVACTLDGKDRKLKLLFGFHRHAAVAKLNKDQGAGLKLPYIILDRTEALAQLKTQVSENNQRQELSPMDKAVAMKGMLDNGVSRKDVRSIFAVPGGRKGTHFAPMSNSTLNIHLRFLELPKTIQEKIHSGSLTWAAAYELGRVTPDKRTEVLKKAEEEQERQLSKEARDEQKYLDAEKKLIEAENTQRESAVLLDKTRQGIVDAQTILAEQQKTFSEVQKEVGGIVTGKKANEKDKKAAAEKLKAAQTDLTGAEKSVQAAKEEAEKAEKKAKAAAEKAKEIREKLEAQRKALKTKKANGVGPTAIKKAAQETEGAREGGHVPLNIQSIREFLKEGATQTEYAKTAKVFKYLRSCCDGVSFPKEAIGNIAMLLGEKKAIVPPTEPAK